MKIRIDLRTCLRSGQCAYLQPEVFALGPDGAPYALVDEVGPEHRAMVEDAMAMCPSQAISLVDD